MEAKKTKYTKEFNTVEDFVDGKNFIGCIKNVLDDLSTKRQIALSQAPNGLKRNSMKQIIDEDKWSAKWFKDTYLLIIQKQSRESARIRSFVEYVVSKAMQNLLKKYEVDPYKKSNKW